MSDPVPAIAEASATGAVAEIFADIRTVLGVEVVNLIWRHLATIPDALPWAWGMLRPLYADGTIRAEAQALQTRIALPHLPPFPYDLLAAVGLGGDDLASIRNILAAYDRTNAMALIALSALLCRLDGVPAESGQAALGTPEQSAPPPFGNFVASVARPRRAVGADRQSRADLEPARHATGQSRSGQHVSSPGLLAQLFGGELGANRTAGRWRVAGAGNRGR
jgi:hypothetical protein